MQVPMWELLLPCWRKPKACVNVSSISPQPAITVTDWPLWRCRQLRADRLTDRKHRSAAHTNLGRPGIENRYAGPVWHRQLLPHQHFNQHHVKLALVSLRNRLALAPGVASREPTESLSCCRRRGYQVPQQHLPHLLSCQIIRIQSSWVTLSYPRKWQLILGWQRRALRSS